ncbi:hypothetical protein ACIRRA_16325 [Nocardia sp. NPDC101769]|uniref:hypothetical protein n=1 Tax=Nocardia sp. NPDC101769 TaxID=3364333 RepID=UPI003816C4ED
MISRFRRTATAVAALALIGSAGTGIAGAVTPVAAGPARAAVPGGVRTWFDPLCEWNSGFDWHYYEYCDYNYWRGSHRGDWESFDRRNHGYDYRWHH